MSSKLDDYALSISVFQHQGGREAQEDAYCVAPVYPGHLLAVFDGHCGARVAQTAAVRLPMLFADRLDRLGVLHAQAALRLALGDLIASCASGFPEDGHRTAAGSTVTAAFAMPSPDGEHLDVVAGVLGDSPLMALCQGDVLIGPEHSVTTSPDDVATIRAASADALRTGRLIITSHYLDIPTASLAPTRSLGDPEFREFLIQEPEMLAFHMRRGEPLLLATDGIHEAADNASARRMHFERVLRLAHQGLHAREIGFQVLMEMEQRAARTYRSFQPDNVTLIVLR